MKRVVGFALLVTTSCVPHPLDTLGGEGPTLDADSTVAYNRSDWGRWKDVDKDCQNTRQEVLIEESVEPVVLDERGCKVLSGRWKCPLTGSWYTNPSNLDIDHTVPLKAAHNAGGSSWTTIKKSSYFNDLNDTNHLMATSASANRSKGSRTPLEWMPPNVNFHCDYLRSWVTIKSRWGLSIGCDEGRGLAIKMASACGGPKPANNP